MDFLLHNLSALADKTWQQFYMASLATLIAMLIGIPAGIWITRYRKMQTPVLGIASIFQTIPSLALLAMLLPLLGIGLAPALVALTIYAILPITRNTVAGLDGIAPAMTEAANGLGFTSTQKLWMVELPLALPMIVAGVRTAMAMSIGIATLAAFIGAGGLGDFIYQGLSLNNTQLILLGAIPAALLALVMDFIIWSIEKTIAERKLTDRRKSYAKWIVITAVVAIVCLLGGKLYYSKWFGDGVETVTIGSKNFTESIILADMMADMIAAKTHLQVDKKLNLGGTMFAHKALLNDEIDMYPEYTGTAYVDILHLKKAETPAQVYQDVKKAYLKKFHVVWLAPFGFNNTNALMVNQQFAKKHQLQTISDIVPISNRMSIGVVGDFLRRPDGYPGLKKVYHIHFASVKLMSTGLMYLALKNNNVDAIMGFSTDGRITAYHLVMLKDNKHLFPPYYAAPIIREQTLKKYPQIAAALKPLAGLINTETMQQLNYQVDVEKKSPDQVAMRFLQQHGLVKK